MACSFVGFVGKVDAGRRRHKWRIGRITIWWDERAQICGRRDNCISFQSTPGIFAVLLHCLNNAAVKWALFHLTQRRRRCWIKRKCWRHLLPVSREHIISQLQAGVVDECHSCAVCLVEVEHRQMRLSRLLRLLQQLQRRAVWRHWHNWNIRSGGEEWDWRLWLCRRDRRANGLLLSAVFHNLTGVFGCQGECRHHSRPCRSSKQQIHRGEIAETGSGIDHVFVCPLIIWIKRIFHIKRWKWIEQAAVNNICFWLATCLLKVDRSKVQLVKCKCWNSKCHKWVRLMIHDVFHAAIVEHIRQLWIRWLSRWRRRRRRCRIFLWKRRKTHNKIAANFCAFFVYFLRLWYAWWRSCFRKLRKQRMRCRLFYVEVSVLNEMTRHRNKINIGCWLQRRLSIHIKRPWTFNQWVICE